MLAFSESKTNIQPLYVTNCVNIFLSLLLIAECRFDATKGTPLSLKSIKDGVNLTVEVAKVQDYNVSVFNGHKYKCNK